MDTTSQKSKKVKIYMLGRFSLEYDNKIMLEDTGKTHKVWTLLGYLLANHHRTLGTQELPELLCADERSDNPTAAVKNLAYRLRTMLASSGLPKWNYIEQRGGVYGWNEKLDYSLDIDEFAELCSQAKKTTGDDKRKKELYHKAIALYRGKLLPRASCDEWAENLTAYYHRLFVECVSGMYAILAKNEQYEEMLGMCEKAIDIDKYDEKIYEIYIFCLIKSNRHKEAVTAYGTITGRLYDELGVNPSAELRELYRDIITTLKSVETDLLTIKEDLNESDALETSYFCEYHIFRDVYRVIARRVARCGQLVHIMLCTLAYEDEKTDGVEDLREAMEYLKTVIGTTTRKGDVFSRYSHAQFVIMLPNTTYADCKSISERVKYAYKKNSISKKVVVHFRLQPLDPKEF